ncbi:MAG: hypothetical protein RMK74_17145, partial [Myxococcales bacterium]|nr:hypothetical protein [Myxococcales bacterium]
MLDAIPCLTTALRFVAPRVRPRILLLLATTVLFGCSDDEIHVGANRDAGLDGGPGAGRRELCGNGMDDDDDGRIDDGCP